MINSKGIKILCYIVMGLMFAISLLLIICGISQLADKNTSGIIWLVLAIASPLIVTVSLYPIFALANIEENLLQLNQKVDGLITKENRPVENKCVITTSIAQHDSPVSKPTTRTVQTSKFTQINRGDEAVNYINEKYGIQISLDDDFDTIKSKIGAIEEGGFNGIPFKRKVLAATTKEEIINIFVMHKVAYS